MPRQIANAIKKTIKLSLPRPTNPLMIIDPLKLAWFSLFLAVYRGFISASYKKRKAHQKLI
jgi:hypothetical protein